MSKNSISSIIEGNSNELSSNNSVESTENTTNNVDMISSSIMNPQNLINNHNGSTSKSIANPSMINLKNSYEDIKDNRNIDGSNDNNTIISNNINSNTNLNGTETAIVSNSQNMDLPESSSASLLTNNISGISNQITNTMIDFPQTTVGISYNEKDSSLHGDSTVTPSNPCMTTNDTNSPSLFQISTTNKMDSIQNNSMIEPNTINPGNGVGKIRLPTSTLHINIDEKIRKRSQQNSNPSSISFASTVESSSNHLRIFQRMDEMAARMITMEEQLHKLTEILNSQNKNIERLETVMNNFSYEMEQNRLIEQKRQEHQRNNCMHMSRDRQFIVDLLKTITNISSAYLSQKNIEKESNDNRNIHSNINDKNIDDIITTNMNFSNPKENPTQSKFISDYHDKDPVTSLNVSNSVPNLYNLQSSNFTSFKKNISGNHTFVLNPNGIKKRKRLHLINQARQLSQEPNTFSSFNNDCQDKFVSTSDRVRNKSNISRATTSTETRTVPDTTVINMDSNIPPSNALDPLNINHFMYSSSQPAPTVPISTSQINNTSNIDPVILKNHVRVSVVQNSGHIDQENSTTSLVDINNNINNSNNNKIRISSLAMKNNAKNKSQSSHLGKKVSNVGILEDEDGYQEDDDEEEDDEEYDEEEEDNGVKQTNESFSESIEDEEEDNEDIMDQDDGTTQIHASNNRKRITTKNMKISKGKSMKKVKSKINGNPNKTIEESSVANVNSDLNYKILKAPNTVRTIWEEYVHGINGNPSIRGLEEKYGNKWRLTKNRKTFSRRKRLYKYILNGIDRGKTADEMIKILEERRLYRDENGEVKRRTIGWLQQSLTGI